MPGVLTPRVIKRELAGVVPRAWFSRVGAEGAENSAFSHICSRDRESVSADVKAGGGRAFVTYLGRSADVLVENRRTAGVYVLELSNEQLPHAQSMPIGAVHRGIRRRRASRPSPNWPGSAARSRHLRPDQHQSRAISRLRLARGRTLI